MSTAGAFGLGSAGCQPAVADSLSATLWRGGKVCGCCITSRAQMFAAGCRELQAGSLRSPASKAAHLI